MDVGVYLPDHGKFCFKNVWDFLHFTVKTCLELAKSDRLKKKLHDLKYHSCSKTHTLHLKKMNLWAQKTLNVKSPRLIQAGHCIKTNTHSHTQNYCQTYLPASDIPLFLF